MSRRSPFFTTVNVEVTSSMAILQVSADRHFHNITPNCYSHYFLYDTATQIEETFTGLSLSELSGVFITLLGLMVCAVCALLMELYFAPSGDRVHIERLHQDEAVRKALEYLALKWHIRQLVCEAGAVHSVELDVF
jgi:hypothetical protein